MPEALLTGLRLIFLALVYLFVWQVARSISSHLNLRQGGKGRRPGTRLVVVGSDTQRGLDFTVRDSLVLGRSSESDLMIDDPYASEFHLRLTSKDDRLILTDLGSTNGTYVNGRRVTAPVDLSRGDSVQVGKTVMEVR